MERDAVASPAPVASWGLWVGSPAVRRRALLFAVLHAVDRSSRSELLTAQELQSQVSQGRVEEMEPFWSLSLAGSLKDGLAGPARGDRERPVKGLEAEGALIRKVAWEDAPNFLHCSNLPLCSPPHSGPPSCCRGACVPGRHPSRWQISLSALSLRPLLAQTGSSP